MDGRGRGVVSTANYRAREYGIHSAMPISRAWQLSEAAQRKGKPAAVFVSTNGRRYHEVSERIMTIVGTYAEHIEQVSVDEAYLDLSASGSYEKAVRICLKLKKEVSEKERLTASVGIGPNKLIAKIASDRWKPDGLTVVREEEAEKFLEPLPIRVIPGIGSKTEALFIKKGIRSVGDLKKFSRDEMENFLGKWGKSLYEKVRGRDASPLVSEWVAKSVGEQETFETDTSDPSFVSGRLCSLAQTVIRRFTNDGFRTFTRVVLTVRFADFETKTKSRTLQNPERSYGSLAIEGLALLLPFFDRRENPRRKKIRLVGIRVERLE